MLSELWVFAAFARCGQERRRRHYQASDRIVSFQEYGSGHVRRPVQSVSVFVYAAL